MSIKLIASDLDGTLLESSEKPVSAEAMELIAQLMDKGICFVPASGRQFPCMHRLFAPLSERMLILCENGALVMKDGKPIYKRYFDRELALEIAHEILKDDRCEVLICGVYTSYVIPKKQEFVHYYRDEIGNDITIIDTPEEVEEEILKVSLYTDHDHQVEVEAAYAEKFADRCQMMISGLRWTDFAPNGTDKGAGLAVLAEYLGLQPEEVAAFGDNENDRSMLEYAGNPYLMEVHNPTMNDVKAKPCRRVEESLREILEGME